jgi:hypothetical protein
MQLLAKMRGWNEFVTWSRPIRQEQPRFNCVGTKL